MSTDLRSTDNRCSHKLHADIRESKSPQRQQLVAGLAIVSWLDFVYAIAADFSEYERSFSDEFAGHRSCHSHGGREYMSGWNRARQELFTPGLFYSFIFQAESSGSSQFISPPEKTPNFIPSECVSCKNILTFPYFASPFDIGEATLWRMQFCPLNKLGNENFFLKFISKENLCTTIYKKNLPK